MMRNTYKKALAAALVLIVSAALPVFAEDGELHDAAVQPGAGGVASADTEDLSEEPACGISDGETDKETSADSAADSTADMAEEEVEDVPSEEPDGEKESGETKNAAEETGISYMAVGSGKVKVEDGKPVACPDKGYLLAYITADRDCEGHTAGEALSYDDAVTCEFPDGTLLTYYFEKDHRDRQNTRPVSSKAIYDGVIGSGSDSVS